MDKGSFTLTDLFNPASRRELWQRIQPCVAQHNNPKKWRQQLEANKQTIECTLTLNRQRESYPMMHSKQFVLYVFSRYEGKIKTPSHRGGGSIRWLWYEPPTNSCLIFRALDCGANRQQRWRDGLGETERVLVREKSPICCHKTNLQTEEKKDGDRCVGAHTCPCNSEFAWHEGLCVSPNPEGISFTC